MDVFEKINISGKVKVKMVTTFWRNVKPYKGKRKTSEGLVVYYPLGKGKFCHSFLRRLILKSREVKRPTNPILITSSGNGSRKPVVDYLSSFMEYLSCLKSIKATLQKAPWFKTFGKKVNFSQETPKICYPRLCINDAQDDCECCVKSEEFFSGIGEKYQEELNRIEEVNEDLEAKKMTTFCNEAIPVAEDYKHHELLEFAEYVLEKGQNLIDKDQPYRVELERWMRLQKYTSFLEVKLKKMKQTLIDKVGDPGVISSDRNYKTLKLHIDEGKELLKHSERRLVEMVLSEQKSKLMKDPTGFFSHRNSILDVLINRVSNAMVMTHWLQDRLEMYLKKIEINVSKNENASESVPSGGYEGYEKGCDKMKMVNESNFSLKLCNTSRRHWNEVEPQLPRSLSHLFAFTDGDKIEEMHPSWYRTFLNVVTTTSELKELHQRNCHLDCHIKLLENDIQRKEIERRVYSYIKKQFSDNE